MLMIFFFSPIFVIVYLICFFESGKPLFIQKRLGKNKKPFYLIKFRTMLVNTPSLASHLVNIKSVTKFGKIIRLLKFDELPQIINVIKGEMSLVGPRPCLPCQSELIQYRQDYDIFSVKPGVTGLAQIKGIDMSKPAILARMESKMICKYNQLHYFKYLFLTFFGKGFGDKIRF